MPPDADLGAARTGEGDPGDPTGGFLTMLQVGLGVTTFLVQYMTVPGMTVNTSWS